MERIDVDHIAIDLTHLLNRVCDEGMPVELEHNKVTARIVPAEPGSSLKKDLPAFLPLYLTWETTLKPSPKMSYSARDYLI